MRRAVHLLEEPRTTCSVKKCSAQIAVKPLTDHRDLKGPPGRKAPLALKALPALRERKAPLERKGLREHKDRKARPEPRGPPARKVIQQSVGTASFRRAQPQGIRGRDGSQRMAALKRWMTVRRGIR